jgi:hypothetical protein
MHFRFFERKCSVLLEEATLPKVYFQILLSKIYLSWQRQRPSFVHCFLNFIYLVILSLSYQETGVTTLGAAVEYVLTEFRG